MWPVCEGCVDDVSEPNLAVSARVLGWTIDVQSVTTIALVKVLRRAAAALLEEFRAGTWTPAREEHELAEGLARARWSGASFRAALREMPAAVRSGRLVDVLEPAAGLLDDGIADVEDTLLQLRVLIDALTAAP